MLNRKAVMGVGVLMVFGLLVVLLAVPNTSSSAASADRVGERAAEVQVAAAIPQVEVAAAPQAANDRLILQYAAKFVCMEPLQPGQYWYGAVAPLVKEATGVVIHNPNSFPVTLYKKAVRAPVENPNTIAQGVAPGKWVTVTLAPDYAFHVDCDDIAKLLTGNTAATFIGTFGIGVEVEGMVVIAIGPQVNAAGTPLRYGPLDVTAEYVRSSEVMKKDIHYQPWWTWWWWGLPWRLGYAYERVIPVQNPTLNIDCRSLLYDALHEDVTREVSPTLQTLTHVALDAGRLIDPTNVAALEGQTESALVALIGGCRKIVNGTALNLDIDYVLLSNKGPTDNDPRGGAQQPDQILYPWWPGRWYDLPVVHPQNRSTDLDKYFREWHTQQWIAAGETEAVARQAMVYWFPYWCGWNYWWWWGNSNDCTDIAVGAGESLDVEQVTPTRVFMVQWPPVP
jgi:hypothetical protein